MSRELLGQPGTPPTSRILIRAGSRNSQLNLGARTDITPNRKRAAQKLCAFAHASQTKVPRTAFVTQTFRVNALAIVANPQTKLLFVVPDFHFDLLCIGVLEGIAYRLACNPVDFVPQDRMEIPRGSFHLHIELGTIWVHFTAPNFFTQSADCQPTVVAHPRR